MKPEPMFSLPEHNPTLNDVAAVLTRIKEHFPAGTWVGATLRGYPPVLVLRILRQGPAIETAYSLEMIEMANNNMMIEEDFIRTAKAEFEGGADVHP